MDGCAGATIKPIKDIFSQKNSLFVAFAREGIISKNVKMTFVARSVSIKMSEFELLSRNATNVAPTLDTINNNQNID